jgi:4-amino-4-deoxy-L-arabinose transferase-like glycosyltransferase
MFQGRPVAPAGLAAYRSALFTLALLLFIVVSRWPLAPKYLYYFDSANFAYALTDFNPALHQPQPPGYPLFVAFTRMIHLWVVPPERVFLIAGLLAAAAATLLIRVFGSDMFGRTAGTLAAALLASNPVFWFGGITNQIRVFLALSAVSVSLLAWRALKRSESPGWLYATFACLGIAGGFRPVLAGLLLPLVLWAWFRTGHSLRRLSIGIGLLAATVAPWLGVTVWAVGGPKVFLDILWSYATVQFEPTSAVFGADGNSAYVMFASAVVWNFLGPLVWLWAVPFRLWRGLAPGWKEKAAFLAIGFLPSFLFSAFIHIGDPDQGLASISILCVIGGAVLATFVERRGPRRLSAAISGVVLVQCILFFFPPSRIAWAASYRAVAAVDRMNTQAISAIQSLRAKGPVTIVHYGSSVASRHLSYYFPDDYLVVLPGSPKVPMPGGPIQLFHGHKSPPGPRGISGLIRPDSRRIICLLPFNATPEDLPGWKTYGSVYYLEPVPREGVAIGPHNILPESR